MLLEGVKCTPWTEGGRVATAATTLRCRHITAAQIRDHGPTDGCAGCCGDSAVQNAPRRARFAPIWKTEEEQAAAAGPLAAGRGSSGVRVARAAAAAAAAEPASSAPAASEEEQQPGDAAPVVGEDVVLEDVLLQLLQLGVEDPAHQIRPVCRFLTIEAGLLGLIPLAVCCEGDEQVGLPMLPDDGHAVLELLHVPGKKQNFSFMAHQQLLGCCLTSVGILCVKRPE